MARISRSKALAGPVMLGALVLVSGTATGVDFCVGSSVDLEAALVTSITNGAGSDTIRVRAGTYLSPLAGFGAAGAFSSGDSITIEGLSAPEGVEIVTEGEIVVASVIAPTVVEEPEEPERDVRHDLDVDPRVVVALEPLDGIDVGHVPPALELRVGVHALDERAEIGGAIGEGLAAAVD